MKNLVKLLCDVACCVGCCVGVGFLSGKEAQVFFGNAKNVAIFAVTFAAVTFVLREFCRINGCSTVGKMSATLIGKKSFWGNALVAFCSFVCIVTSLAGVEQCFAAAIDKLPLYAVATATFAALLLGKMRLIKFINVLSVVCAAILIFLPGKTAVCTAEVAPYKPVAYALFSATVSLGMTAKLACESTLRQNALSATISSVAIALLMYAMLKTNVALPVAPNVQGVFATVTLLLAAVTGIVANAMPVLELIEDVVGDRAVSCVLIFGLAIALSMFGFDFAVKIGYTAVACVGAGLTALVVAKLAPKLRKNKNRETDVFNSLCNNE